MNAEVFSKIENLSMDTIDEIMEELDSLGVTDIREVEQLPSNVGTTIHIITNIGKHYYLGVGEYGFLEIIREDSMTGKIVFVPIED